MLLNYITWDASPIIVDLGFIQLRWYGLLFALSFLIGLELVKRMFKVDDVPESWLDKLFIYVVIGAVVGARLGHVFFYEWDFYSQNLGEIYKIHKGGLASHGGAMGIFLALWLYSKYVSKKSMLWIMDRLAAPVALAAGLIRLGNLMNSEIIGHATDKPWAFVFTAVDDVARHPVQLYEAILYLLAFAYLLYAYWNNKDGKQDGYFFGLFMAIVFTARFCMEFFKESLGGLEEQIGQILSTGQLLSISFIIIGLYFVFTKR